MRNYEPLTLSPTLEDFVKRRSAPHVNSYQSLQTIAANAYIQGMNDAMDALQHKTTKGA